MSFEDEHGFGDRKTVKDRLKGKKKEIAKKLVHKAKEAFKGKTESEGQKSMGGNLKNDY